MEIKIFATCKKGIYKGEKEEISNNLYWFEENSVTSFADKRYDFEILINGLRVYPFEIAASNRTNGDGISSNKEYQRRLVLAKAIYAMPVKDNMPGQKFPRGARVYVGEMPSYMAHFDSNFEGIVEHTYAQKFWGNDIKSYCLIILKDGKPINSCAWYYEDQLTLISDDIQEGLKIIEEYYGKRTS